MPKKKTSKAAEGFEISKEVQEDPVFQQINVMEIKEPENLTLEEALKEYDEVGIAIMKAINGHHRDVIAGAADAVLEIFVRRRKT